MHHKFLLAVTLLGGLLLASFSITFQQLLTMTNNLIVYDGNDHDKPRQLSFRESMIAFDWDTFERAEENKSTDAQMYWRQLFNLLVEFNIMEPRVPINTECKAPKLLESKEVDCSQYPDAFLPEKRESSARIGHMIQLGFDVDTLEVHLNELADVVDYFFIIEWTESHNKQVSHKRLTWEAVKKQPRFEKFQDKVVHFILDDVDTMTVTNNNGQWAREGYQEGKRWTKFQEWNIASKHFGPNDVLGFGDADEIPSRKNVQLLKFCNIKGSGNKLDIGIWFPYGKVDYAFRTDWPVKNHPYTLGDPTFYLLKEAEKPKTPNRQRGTSGPFLLGGMHMTHYGYLPFQIIKGLTCTECNNQGRSQQTMRKQISAAVKEQSWVEMEKYWSRQPEALKNRIPKISESGMSAAEAKKVIYLPWFYDCNRDRYPLWESKHDSRLD